MPRIQVFFINLRDLEYSYFYTSNMANLSQFGLYLGVDFSVKLLGDQLQLQVVTSDSNPTNF
jgi:hypothetical protein